MLSEMELELLSGAASMLALLGVLMFTRPPKAQAPAAEAGAAAPTADNVEAAGDDGQPHAAQAEAAVTATSEMAELCNQLAAQVQKLRLRVHELEHLVDGLREGPVGRVETTRDPMLARATEMARDGATADTLIGDCNLTRGEAELLTRLHGAGSDHAHA